MIVNDKLEALEYTLSWMDHQPHYLARNVEYNPENNVVGIVHRAEGLDYNLGKNVITNDGALFYAAKAVGANSGFTNFDNSDATMVMIQGTETESDSYDAIAKTDTGADLVANSRSPIPDSYDTTENIHTDFPKLDGDIGGLNTSKGPRKVTWTQEWNAGAFSTEANHAGREGAITNSNGNITWNASQKILNHWSFTPFTKTTNEPLTVFVNHNFEQ